MGALRMVAEVEETSPLNPFVPLLSSDSTNSALPGALALKVMVTTVAALYLVSSAAAQPKPTAAVLFASCKVDFVCASTQVVLPDSFSRPISSGYSLSAPTMDVHSNFSLSNFTLNVKVLTVMAVLETVTVTVSPTCRVSIVPVEGLTVMLMLPLAASAVAGTKESSNNKLNKRDKSLFFISVYPPTINQDW